MPRASTQIRAFRGRSQYCKSQQKGYKKMDANPNAFCALPREIVERIGLRHHIGCRIETAALAAFAYHYKRNRGDSVMRYQGGDLAEFGDEVFVLSIQTIAEDLFTRWFGKLSNAPNFERFYERVKKTVHRLRDKRFVVQKGYVAGGPAKGTWWTLHGTPLEGEDLPGLPAGSLFVLRSGIPEPKDLPGETINTVDLVGSLFAEESCEDYHLSEISVSLRDGDADRWRYHDFQEWTKGIAEEPTNGERHASIGATREPYVKDEQAYYVPWLVLDFDRSSPLEAVASARRATREIIAAGVPASAFCVCPTGGTGVHIQVPMGLFGNPVFAGRSQAKKGLRALAESLTEERVDHGLFDPRHLYRLTGSRHPEGRGWKTSFRAEEFLGLSAAEVLESTREPTPVDYWPDPRKAPPDPELVLLMMEAASRTQLFRAPPAHKIPDLQTAREGGGTNEAFEHARMGVGEGEVWHVTGEGEHLVGRNRASFQVSVCLFARGWSEKNVWQEMLAINQSNAPPLGERELRSCYKSGQRYAEKNRES